MDGNAGMDVKTQADKWVGTGQIVDALDSSLILPSCVLAGRTLGLDLFNLE